MDKAKTIFGFGSLISTPSLLATAPNVTDVRPAYIKGFIRSFNFWDAIGYTETNLDLAGEPMCALDVTRCNESEARVNGVAFTVSGTDLTNLLRREEGYELITVPLFDYETNQSITDEGLVFSANKNDGEYVFDGKAQRRYLDDYLNAAKQYGDRYCQELLDTTFIENQPLSEIVQLAAVLESMELIE